MVLTPQELCKIDDAASSIIVDPYLRFRTHKMSTRFRSRIDEDDLRQLLSDFRSHGDIERAIDDYMQTATMQAYWRAAGRLKSSKTKVRDVRDHLAAYLLMFSRDAGFEIRPCYRYADERHLGAKLCITQFFRRDEVIKCLIGKTALLTDEDEKKILKPGVNDFSVIYSTRKSMAMLWLGPAAYVNHDCDPSCELVCKGNQTVVLRALRDLHPMDEITIYYGDGFFGNDNEFCECETCQHLNRGAFAKKDHPSTDSSDGSNSEEKGSEESNGTKRRRGNTMLQSLKTVNLGRAWKPVAVGASLSNSASAKGEVDSDSGPKQYVLRDRRRQVDMGTLRHNGFSLAGLLAENSNSDRQSPTGSTPPPPVARDSNGLVLRKRGLVKSQSALENGASTSSQSAPQVAKRQTLAALAAARSSPTIPPFPQERRTRRMPKQTLPVVSKPVIKALPVPSSEDERSDTISPSSCQIEKEEEAIAAAEIKDAIPSI